MEKLMEQRRLCYTCKLPMRYIQAGVSKATGKPYDAFWSCQNKCKVRIAPEGEIIKKAETVNASLIIMDEVKKIHQRLTRMETSQTAMFKWLESKLSDSLGIEQGDVPMPTEEDLL